MSLHLDKVRALCDIFYEWAVKCDEMRELAKTATGETKEAYALVYRDYLWKLQAKAGQLWFYVCGDEGMNPFTLPPALEGRPRNASDTASVEQ